MPEDTGARKGGISFPAAGDRKRRVGERDGRESEERESNRSARDVACLAEAYYERGSRLFPIQGSRRKAEEILWTGEWRVRDASFQRIID